MSRAANALTGAYVADAATLGVHWLYDPERIASLGNALWRDPNPAEFEGAKGIFVHHDKHLGDISQYGAQMRVMVRTLAKGPFDAQTYHSEFGAAFGPGGWWQGYIDKATRGTLANIAAGANPTGADDDHIPALGGLPPLLAMGESRETCADAVAQISASGTTALYAPPAAIALQAILSGKSKADALEEAAHSAPGLPLADALASTVDPVDYAGSVGRACPLAQSLSVAFRIAAACETYVDAVDMNARVAGDNCGRAIFLGAFFGAMDPPPALWCLKLEDGPVLAAEIEAMLAR